jgi:uncharacterized delta-60 repeat protein
LVRSIAAGCLIAAVSSVAATPGFAAPALDARFGDDGVARVPLRFADPGGEVSGALRPVRQPDGKVLVPALIHRYSGGAGVIEQVVVARFERSGRRDRSFGRGGRVRIGVRGWGFHPAAVRLQADGGIVVVGTASGIGTILRTPWSYLAIVRLLPDGSRDRAFGTNGLILWNPPWSFDDVLMQVWAGIAVAQPGGRLLVAAQVDEQGRDGFPRPTRSRVVLVRFDPDGSVDESFGRSGIAELDWDQGHISGWARLPGGRVAAVSPRQGTETPLATGWWLLTFAADGPPDGRLASTAASYLGPRVLGGLAELAASRDGGLLMTGPVDLAAERGPGAPAVRRILPDGSLDPVFGRRCRDRPPRGVMGGSPTPRGGALVTETSFRGSWAVPYDEAGCVTATPLHLRGLRAGPPLLGRGRSAFLGASYEEGLALVKIRR